MLIFPLDCTFALVIFLSSILNLNHKNYLTWAILVSKRRLRDRKTEHFKTPTTACHESAIADHVFLANHRIKWNHFEILATG